MTSNTPFSFTASGHCDATMEADLNAYVDGELPDARQRRLFSHLAICDTCRRTLDAVIKFRRMSRMEYLAVPPVVDEAFFNRLARHREQARRFDRAADRKPLWYARTPVSLRVALLVAVGLFFVGVFVPGNMTEEPVTMPVLGEEERIEFVDLDLPPSRFEAVYVFYPGLTIEATQPDEQPPPGSL